MFLALKFLKPQLNPKSMIFDFEKDECFKIYISVS